MYKDWRCKSINVVAASLEVQRKNSWMEVGEAETEGGKKRAMILGQ